MHQRIAKEFVGKNLHSGKFNYHRTAGERTPFNLHQRRAGASISVDTLSSADHRWPNELDEMPCQFIQFLAPPIASVDACLILGKKNRAVS
jgi:hypothetical protein